MEQENKGKPRVVLPYEDTTDECSLCGHFPTEEVSSDGVTEITRCPKCRQEYERPVDTPEPEQDQDRTMMLTAAKDWIDTLYSALDHENIAEAREAVDRLNMILADLGHPAVINVSTDLRNTGDELAQYLEELRDGTFEDGNWPYVDQSISDWKKGW